MDSLKAHTVLTAAFPDLLGKIKVLRQVDSEFDEICSDFVALAGIAAASENSRDADNLLESLVDLKHEIETALRLNEYTTNLGHRK